MNRFKQIFRSSGEAFKNDNGVLIFTEMGFNLYKEQLVGYEFMFAFMPYMHTEHIGYQNKGRIWFRLHKNIYENKADNGIKYRPLTNPNKISMMTSIEPTQYDKEYTMLKSMESHVKGHLNVISRFNRFPKRNVALGRVSTPEEISYMEDPEVKKRPY